MDHLFIGSIIHCKSFEELETIDDIAVKNGKIVAIGDSSDIPIEFTKTLPLTKLSKSQFLVPGFINCHIHAPQYPNCGLGLDLPLLDWLKTYTFPLEYNYKDTIFARNVYEIVIRRTISCGTTLAAYFATNHKDASLILAEKATKFGQQAFIGKVCSNCSSPDYYIETTSQSLSDTEDFIKSVLQLNNPKVQPIVTPRFALSCTVELMQGLGELAAKYDLNIQSHISENVYEVEEVKKFNKTNTYTEAYAKPKLLTKKCVLAYGVHLTDEELEMLRKFETAIAHCPTSNIKIQSGMCDVRRLMNAGVKVGLGTDISGGQNPSMLIAMQDALNVSQCLNFAKKQHIVGTGRSAEHEQEQNKNYVPLNYKNALYLATLGGAKALAVEDKCGNFAVGKEFDGLLIDIDTTPLQVFEIPEIPDKTVKEQPKLEKMIQKFLYVGDDRNILKVFVGGKQVKN